MPAILEWMTGSGAAVGSGGVGNSAAGVPVDATAQRKGREGLLLPADVFLADGTEGGGTEVGQALLHAGHSRAVGVRQQAV